MQQDNKTLHLTQLMTVYLHHNVLCHLTLNLFTNTQHTLSGPLRGGSLSTFVPGPGQQLAPSRTRESKGSRRVKGGPPRQRGAQKVKREIKRGRGRERVIHVTFHES
ncbi:unnamed protein product [Meganyctiphanes norvegica]|uniref:Uncharacterized protein n=1 Tax=Meganyctiphanes norvegica TaxID=48144 RepID=A0AAV2SUB3_MEGNR